MSGSKIIDFAARRDAIRSDVRQRLWDLYAGSCLERNIFAIVDGGADIDLGQEPPLLNEPATIDTFLLLHRVVGQALAQRRCVVEGVALPGAEVATWILPLLVVDVALRRPEATAQVVRDAGEVTGWAYVGLLGLDAAAQRAEIERSIALATLEEVFQVDTLVQGFLGLLRSHSYMDPVLGRQAISERALRASKAAAVR